jgi:sterol desaturase/sphingolipid hydroxylase (fatty acid hydroxylase superfamily)
MKVILITIIAIGFLVELLGYLWHRFCAHLGYAGDIIRKPHFEHHEIYYPHNNMETFIYRVKGFLKGDSWPWFVPILSIYTVVLYLWWKQIINKKMLITITIWMMFHIYLISYIHDSYHIQNHWLNRFDWYRENKVCHNLHHYYNCNYGISNYSMDRLFGTLITKYNNPKENIFEGFVYPI